MQLDALFTEAALAAAVGAGNVSARRHPTDPLTIYNYTKQCAWARAWDDVTRRCRGLIVRDDGEVVARPFEKFFNYGEHEADAFDLGARVRVTDKLDGSLGILYRWRGGLAIATRGSFESDQALHASRVLLERYPDFAALDGFTYLFEIIYPGNRVVVDYGDLDDVVLLDVLDTETGLPTDYLPALAAWPGASASELSYATLADALAAPPRPNAEGIVVTFADGARVKVKQDDYVELHRLVTGLNERVVWERLADGSAEDLKAGLPEEFWGWIDDVADRLILAERDLAVAAHSAHHAAVIAVSDVGRREWERKDYALWVGANVEKPLQGLCFMLLDRRPIDDAIWQRLRPAGAVGPRANTGEEDS